MDIELVNIDDLNLDPRNARKHDDKNLKAIAGSLETFGQRKPIVVWGKTVVAGNGTMAAARTLGWTEIEIVRVPDDWSSDQVKAYALADNRSAELAVWDDSIMSLQLKELIEVDFDIEALGFDVDFKPADQEELFDAFENLANEKGEMEVITFTLHKFQAEALRAALIESKSMGDFGDTGNQNSNGNALARIIELWSGQNVG
jgi:ParB-like chromosome segregation protein Spo0J